MTRSDEELDLPCLVVPAAAPPRQCQRKHKQADHQDCADGHESQ